tara:strand:+ start:94 stop:312 length:219 start_codon:yes stop_codon:yes gene_type:complete
MSSIGCSCFGKNTENKHVNYVGFGRLKTIILLFLPLRKIKGTVFALPIDVIAQKYICYFTAAYSTYFEYVIE